MTLFNDRFTDKPTDELKASELSDRGLASVQQPTIFTSFIGHIERKRDQYPIRKTKPNKRGCFKCPEWNSKALKVSVSNPPSSFSADRLDIF